MDAADETDNDRLPSRYLPSPSAAKGMPFTTIAVLGQLEDGSTWISGNANAGETLVLMERAKRIVVFGESE